MYKNLQPVLQQKLKNIKEQNLFKNERVITTPQGAVIRTKDGREVINFCANNYLGLSAHPRVIEAAKKGDRYAWLRHVFRPVYLWYTGYS